MRRDYITLVSSCCLCNFSDLAKKKLLSLNRSVSKDDILLFRTGISTKDAYHIIAKDDNITPCIFQKRFPYMRNTLSETYQGSLQENETPTLKHEIKAT